GSRMQASLPKQFLEIGSKPILMHTIQRFVDFDPEMRIVVVLPEAQIEYWRQLCTDHFFSAFHVVVPGGETRFQSVKNGLSVVSGAGVVAVHDGVRPFIDAETIGLAFKTAAEKGNAITAVALKDSIRKVTGKTSEAVDRKQYRLIQTPQCFRVELLKQAYQQEEQEFFTDDASVVEQTGEVIHLVAGSYRNIKITTPEDLLVAEAFLNG
ncbi:MAG: 2-C-methyl-D-erythritol 4-phosphate cytidylyltransferase, partial [Hymenobacteraceae bacterium]|nr:2-C-methyl-D-erythritol 4-phosphate cytidylyltransferase [Hymenobacteraceae bacterium]MDX5395873.1 2-C-methyl-D-erythritol 4-phosphate cytidylyltransferase [Hymenobacteraceae bacterium]MDX5511928.1 2-C-methyl-D-erythritol 4-phosphate cytidylyltransferase [Hymenobacteraceae bacterium]